MENKQSQPVGTFLMHAVLYDKPDPKDSREMSYGRRDLNAQLQGKEKHPSDRLLRQLDYIHEMFEHKECEKIKNNEINTGESTLEFTFLAHPAIDMNDFFTERPSVLPDSDISETIVFSEDEIKKVFQDIPIVMERDEIHRFAGKAFSIGELFFVRNIISDILTESLIEAGKRSLEECRTSAVKKIKETLAEKGFYLNLLKDRTKPFPERLVLIKGDSLGTIASSPENLYGVPLLKSLPDNGEISCMLLIPGTGGYVLAPGTINVSALTENICVYSLPKITEDRSGWDDFTETVSDIDSDTVLHLSDPGTSKIFDLTEENAAFLASEIYSGEILAKKISRFRISKKYMLEEMEKKIFEIKYPDKETRSLKISSSSFDPKKPLYTKPKIRHTVIRSIVKDIEDEDEKNEIKDREFSGIHGETFEIRTGWMPGEEAACSIASVVCDERGNETVMAQGNEEVCENSLESQMRQAILKIKGRLTEEDINNIERCLDPEESNSKKEFVEETLKQRNLPGDPQDIKKQYEKFTTDPDLYMKSYIQKKNPHVVKTVPEGILHKEIADKLKGKYMLQDYSYTTMEEKRYMLSDLGPPTVIDIDRSVNNFLANDLKNIRYKKSGGYDYIFYDHNDIWKSHMPVFYTHLHGRCGTMQDKPGNITWYTGINCDNVVHERYNMYYSAVPYEEDAKFHTLCNRYEFFNTLAIRKYAGFAAPFIGPAADSVASYRIDPQLPVDCPTESFGDSIKENIYMECIGDKIERKMVLKSRRYENLADFLREYSWIGSKEMPLSDTAEKQTGSINAAYHSFGTDENGSFLEKDADLNSYRTMDMMSGKYFELKKEKFEEFIMASPYFEKDGLNPFDSAKQGYSKYLRAPKEKFELLPKDLKRIPSVPEYYKDALEYENMDKKDRGKSGYTEIKPKNNSYYGSFGKDVSEENIAAKGHLSRPLGVEPYMEPYGSSRRGELERPLESLRFTNTVSRDRKELDHRDTGEEDVQR